MEAVVYLARHGMTEWQERGLNRLAGRLQGIGLSTCLLYTSDAADE